MFIVDLLSAVLVIPAFAVCVYAVERVINHFLEKERRKQRMRLIRKQRRELALELANCA